MTDVDIFAKLSRILETHNLSGDDDDESVIDLLQKIERDGSDDKGFNSSMKKSQNRTRGLSPERIVERPSPFEVWQAKQAGVFSFDSKQSPVLTEQQWDRLVSGLHRTNKVKESATKEQNQGLAHELGGLSFKPKMNATSLVLASTMKSLQQRLPGMLNAREEALKRAREGNEQNEMSECTFKPFREGAKTSEKYLKKIGRKQVSADDFMRYHEEKLRRNEQRRLIIEEIDSKELTFKPQLNAKSLKIQEKLKSDNKIEVDPVSRQTVVMASPIIRQSVAAANTDGSFHPDISSRAKSYRSSVQGGVHNRLYTQAVQQMTHQHNLQVELMRNKVALPTKPWEVQRSADGGPQSWAQSKSYGVKTGRPGDELLVSPEEYDPDAPPVYVVECSEGLGPMWKALRTAVPMEGYFEEADVGPADL